MRWEKIEPPQLIILATEPFSFYLVVALLFDAFQRQALELGRSVVTRVPARAITSRQGATQRRAPLPATT